MKKLLVAILAGLALSGCSTFLSTDVGAKALSKVVDSYEFYCDNLGQIDRKEFRKAFNEHPAVVARNGGAALACDASETVVIEGVVEE